MSRELDRVRNAIVPREQSEITEVDTPLMRDGGFIAFRYSSTEISSQGNGLHVKMKETRFQNGKLVSEECEGMIDRNAYNRVVSEAQGIFFRQMLGFAGMLLAPFLPRGPRRDE